MTGYFVTSTDTDVGKTTVGLCLMKHFKSLGRSVACMKPVSAGCEVINDGLRNADAVKLLSEASAQIPYEWVNPYAFEPPIAPHIAAHLTGQSINIENIRSCYENISKVSEVVIVEGAGGWLVPINSTETMADIAASLNIPVVLIVGIRLGCLNHGLLTANSIEERGVQFNGWIANQIDKDMMYQQENIDALKVGIGAPLLGSVEYCDSLSQCHLNLTQAGKQELC